MWDLLLQLRALLPYLVHLVPLIDQSVLKANPDISELSKGMAEMQTGRHDLEAQVRNQALQLERIEQQMARLGVIHENELEETRRLFTEVRGLRQGLFALGMVIVLLLVVSVGLVTFLVIHS
jgi:hypothetical protein